MGRSPVIIAQARMTSTRLPGKVLLEVLGRPLLVWQLERLARIRDDVRVAVATTDRPTDEPIVALCAVLGVPVVRGSETDVLSRYHDAVGRLDADPIIRVTSDCPLIDPDVSRGVLELWESSGADYASNALERTFPRGLDTEVLSRAVLETAWAEAGEDVEREHVTPFIYGHPERFTLVNLRNSVDDGHRRWTVDTPDDFAFVRAVLEQLVPHSPNFRMADVLALLVSRPEIERLNEFVTQKPLVAAADDGHAQPG